MHLKHDGLTVVDRLGQVILAELTHSVSCDGPRNSQMEPPYRLHNLTMTKHQRAMVQGAKLL